MQTYRVSELGKRFGLSRSTLLYYDRIGLLCPSGRTQAGYRLYTPADLARLEQICLLREAGLSLDNIARVLACGGDAHPALTRRLREISQEIVALKAQQTLIGRMLRRIADGPGESDLNKTLWMQIQKAAGLDAAASRRWHAEFERRAPTAHHDFLLNLGLSEKEAIEVRLLTRSIEDNTMNMKYFFELFETLPRQGPGCEAATLKALGALPPLPPQPAVLDIGCGSGMQTQILARSLGTRIIAIDNHPTLVARLRRSAQAQGLDIEARECSMMDMPFEAASFDLLWAEGSIFIIGLERGLREFRGYLKTGGHLAFTEMCWFEHAPPAEAKAYFDTVYPDIRHVSAVLELAPSCGYEVVTYFNLPDSAWWDDYYTPMLERMQELRSKNAGIAEAEAVYAACSTEIEMFRRHAGSYGYTFFVLRAI